MKIGDEVRYIDGPPTKFVITHLDKHGRISGIGADGIGFFDKNPEKWITTGRYFPEAKLLIDALNKCDR